MRSSLTRERDVLVPLLDQAAAELAARFRTALEWRSKDALGRDPVTEADLASERVLLAGLRRHFPQDAILSEESSDAAPPTKGRRIWIVHPLDGTNNFRQGIPFFCISVALWEDGAPRLGAIRSVVDGGELFLAERGRGATLDGAPLRAGSAASLGAAYCACDSGLSADERTRAARLFSHLAPRVRGVRALGSAALAQAYVACGRLDAYWNAAPLYAWDVGAGLLLVQEAGGRVTRADGAPVDLQPGSLLAAGPAAHAPLLETIRAVENPGR